MAMASPLIHKILEPISCTPAAMSADSSQREQTASYLLPYLVTSPWLWFQLPSCTKILLTAIPHTLKRRQWRHGSLVAPPSNADDNAPHPHTSLSAYTAISAYLSQHKRKTNISSAEGAVVDQSIIHGSVVVLMKKGRAKWRWSGCTNNTMV